jgi:hypothetical protein
MRRLRTTTLAHHHQKPQNLDRHSLSSLKRFHDQTSSLPHPLLVLADLSSLLIQLSLSRLPTSSSKLSILARTSNRRSSTIAAGKIRRNRPLPPSPALSRGFHLPLPPPILHHGAVQPRRDQESCRAVRWGGVLLAEVFWCVFFLFRLYARSGERGLTSLIALPSLPHCVDDEWEYRYALLLIPCLSLLPLPPSLPFITLALVFSSSVVLTLLPVQPRHHPESARQVPAEGPASGGRRVEGIGDQAVAGMGALCLFLRSKS